MIKIFTIGFTKKKAEDFFSLLESKKPALNKVVDVRLKNTSQILRFSVKDDLQYFLKRIIDINYFHLPSLAPTEEIINIIKKSKKKRIDDVWPQYEKEFLKLMRERNIERVLTREFMNGACLLCSEATPEFCHRRLIAEYLQAKWGDVEIIHL